MVSITSALISQVYWPLMEKFKGNKIRSFMDELKAYETLTADEIETRQKQKVAALLKHAVTHVPAYASYKELFLQETEATTLLEQLPCLTKQHFNQHFADYLPTGIDETTLILNRTGGSTGEPTRFYMDRLTVEYYEAARWTGLSWYGIRIGDPSIMIWGSPIELNQYKSRLYHLKERYLKNRMMIPAYDLNPAQLELYLKSIRAFRPVYLYGYASSLTLFAELLLARKLSLDPPLKAVISTAECLHPNQKELIEQAFQTTVVNEYGARDAGIISYQCRHGRMHIFTLNCYVEILDFETKKRLSPGKPGLVVVTDLNNYSMPRLRYQLGDVASLSYEACPCGNAAPVLESIEGREDDMFVTESKRYVHGHFFNHIARNLESFLRFQLIQHTPDSLSMLLVKHPEKYKPAEEALFVQEIRNVIGDKAKINVNYVDEIQPSASGKYRYAIREFPLQF